MVVPDQKTVNPSALTIEALHSITKLLQKENKGGNIEGLRLPELYSLYNSITSALDACSVNASCLKPYIKGQEKELGYKPGDKKLTENIDKIKLSEIVSQAHPIEYDEQGIKVEQRKQDCVDTISFLESKVLKIVNPNNEEINNAERARRVLASNNLSNDLKLAYLSKCAYNGISSASANLVRTQEIEKKIQETSANREEFKDLLEFNNPLSSLQEARIYLTALAKIQEHPQYQPQSWDYPSDGQWSKVEEYFQKNPNATKLDKQQEDVKGLNCYFIRANDQIWAVEPGKAIAHGGFGKVKKCVNREGVIKAVKVEGLEGEIEQKNFDEFTILQKIGQGVSQSVKHYTEGTRFDVSKQKNELDYGSGNLIDKKIFTVMDFYEGGSLHDALKRIESLKTIPEDKKTQIKSELARQALEATRALHEKSIIHCDIKPANFMLSKPIFDSRGEILPAELWGQVELIDFGLAQELNGQPRVKGVGGTMGYSAPEIMSSSSTASDVYALGHMLEKDFGMGSAKGIYENIIQVYRDKERTNNKKLQSIQEQLQGNPEKKLLLLTTKELASYLGVNYEAFEIPLKQLGNQISYERNDAVIADVKEGLNGKGIYAELFNAVKLNNPNLFEKIGEQGPLGSLVTEMKSDSPDKRPSIHQAISSLEKNTNITPTIAKAQLEFLKELGNSASNKRISELTLWKALNNAQSTKDLNSLLLYNNALDINLDTLLSEQAKTEISQPDSNYSQLLKDRLSEDLLLNESEKMVRVYTKSKNGRIVKEIQNALYSLRENNQVVNLANAGELLIAQKLASHASVKEIQRLQKEFLTVCPKGSHEQVKQHFMVAIGVNMLPQIAEQLKQNDKVAAKETWAKLDNLYPADTKEFIDILVKAGAKMIDESISLSKEKERVKKAIALIYEDSPEAANHISKRIDNKLAEIQAKRKVDFESKPVISVAKSLESVPSEPKSQISTTQPKNISSKAHSVSPRKHASSTHRSSSSSSSSNIDSVRAKVRTVKSSLTHFFDAKKSEQNDNRTEENNLTQKKSSPKTRK